MSQILLEKNFKDLRDSWISALANNDFLVSIFVEAYEILASGKNWYEYLLKLSWKECKVCFEKNVFSENWTHDTCSKCKSSIARRKLYESRNDLLPSKTPDCLANLTPVEESAISIVAVLVNIFKVGNTSTSMRGHSVAVQQDLGDFVDKLPRTQEELPYHNHEAS